MTKPATDEEIEAVEEYQQPHNVAAWLWEKRLRARIRADAARIRELEGAADTLLRALGDMHARGETFSGRVSIAAVDLRQALGAAGAGEGQGG